MSTVLVVNRYQCEHLEPFGLRENYVNMLGCYISHNKDSEARELSLNSLKCHVCHDETEIVSPNKEYVALNKLSSQSILPSRPDLMSWYLDLLNDCKSAGLYETELLRRLWSRSVVHLFEPVQIGEFFRAVCGSRDMPQKAALSTALANALAQRVAKERHCFWDYINEAFEVANLRAVRSSQESKCSAMIHDLMEELEAESKLMRLLTLDYPVGITTPPIVLEARRKMGMLDDIIEDLRNALRAAIDSLKALTLDTSDMAQHKVTDTISTGRFFIIALYQLYARKRCLMWQVANADTL